MSDIRVVKNAQTVEYGKFVQLNDTRFPAVSVIRQDLRDQSNAFPNNKGVPPLTSVEIYPKYAVLSHITNPEDIKVSLSAENVNVNLQDVENILNVISPNVADIKTNTNDIEILLDRTNTLLDTLTSNTDQLEVNTDGVEILLDRTNTLLDTLTSNTDQLEVNTDGVEILLDRTNTLLDTLTSRIGGEGPGGSFTKCETRTSGNPSFTPAQIYIHNNTNNDRTISLQLISGMTCTIAVGKDTSSNHAFTLNLAVSGVTNYDSCSITYFA